jgi:hypothetical protein
MFRLWKELITFAILNKVKGAAEYQAQYINNKTQKLKVKSWRAWIIV